MSLNCLVGRIAKNQHRWSSLVAVSFVGASLAFADSASVSQTVAVDLSPAIKLVSIPAATPLYQLSGAFSAFTGSLPVSFRVRTSPLGTGSITISASSEFLPATGPKVANGDLTYSCSNPTIGSGCSSNRVVSVANQTSVVVIPANSCTGGGSSCSTANPNATTINFNLRNLPSFAVGSYASNITFTASAL